MRTLFVKARARMDLLAIARHLSESADERVADAVGDRVATAIEALRDTPNRGHMRSDVDRPGMWFWNVFQYAIAYRYDDRSVTVVASRARTARLPAHLPEADVNFS
ncbi:MAG TPA: type II toxin-antitoxin system RelE/ParE family toxin [Tepidisphaeraceae bacterium]|nr:type II toxin-antitoxin system RelE/ParE family toxin [Tepidisphaeraceae bacterium]